MEMKRIKLYEDREIYLDCYITAELACNAGEKKPAMLIFPGGGYEMCSDREAEPVAKAFLALGMNAFVLYYSIAKNSKFPQPLLDASMAMHIIRSRAEEFRIDPDRVTICGFSAGGHLAASLAAMWHDDISYAALGIPYGENKPNGAILGYAVISGDKRYYHGGSFQNLLGKENPTDEELASWSVNNLVTDKAAPAFIWHTASDAGVPCENSLLLAEAYSAARVPFELHIFPEGPHGLSVATKESNPANPYVARWVPMAEAWMKENKLID